MKLFTYGCLIQPALMAAIAPDSEFVAPAILDGWRLEFSYVATVERRDGARTAGVLWEMIGADGLDALDHFEGKAYVKHEVSVAADFGRVDGVLVYALAEREPDLYPPPDGYLEVIADGYRQVLPADALALLGDALERSIVGAREPA